MPKNIVVDVNDKPMIIDFGMAKNVTDENEVITIVKSWSHSEYDHEFDYGCYRTGGSSGGNRGAVTVVEVPLNRCGGS